MNRRALGPAFVFFLVIQGCTVSMSSNLESSKGLVREFNQAVNSGDWNKLAEIVTPDFSRHSTATPGPPITSLDAFIELQKGFLQSFPDQHVEIQEMISEGNRVAARATYSGTMTGPMGEFPATGKKATVPFLAMFRIQEDKIAELWVEWDNVAMLTQLGLFPPPGP